MKFGIFYEHQLPRPWGEDSEYQLLQNSLGQIELADQLDPEHQEWKQALLDGDLELDEVDSGRFASHSLQTPTSQPDPS